MLSAVTNRTYPAWGNIESLKYLLKLHNNTIPSIVLAMHAVIDVASVVNPVYRFLTVVAEWNRKINCASVAELVSVIDRKQDFPPTLAARARFQDPLV